MASISSVSSTNSIYQTSKVSSGKGTHHLKPDDDSQRGKDSGGFLGAIDTALKAAGVSGGLTSILGNDNASTSSTESTSTDATASTNTSSTDPSSALTAFMQTLMAALQSQGDVNNSTNSSSNSAKSTSESMPPPPPMGMGGGDMESKLQSLMSQLSNSSSSDSSSSSSDGSSLKSSFDSLMASLGKSSSSNGDLQTFLKSLSSSLEGQGTSGNVVSTKV